MWSDGVELDPIGIGLADQVEPIVNLLAVELLVLQALEGPFTDPVLAGRPDMSPNMPEHRVGGDEVSNPKERNGPPLSVTSVIGTPSPVSGSVRWPTKDTPPSMASASARASSTPAIASSWFAVGD